MEAREQQKVTAARIEKSKGKSKAKSKAPTSEKFEDSSMVDRYYRALYSKLVTKHYHSESKHLIFFNLLFKSLRADPVIERVQAFIKRILQVSI